MAALFKSGFSFESGFDAAGCWKDGYVSGQHADGYADDLASEPTPCVNLRAGSNSFAGRLVEIRWVRQHGHYSCCRFLRASFVERLVITRPS
jgi:hypothetical protein